MLVPVILPAEVVAPDCTTALSAAAAIACVNSLTSSGLVIFVSVSQEGAGIATQPSSLPSASSLCKGKGKRSQSKSGTGSLMVDPEGVRDIIVADSALTCSYGGGSSIGVAGKIAVDTSDKEARRDRVGTGRTAERCLP